MNFFQNPELLALRLKQMPVSRRKSSLLTCSADKIDLLLSQLFPDQETAHVLRNVQESMRKQFDAITTENSDDTLPFAPPTPNETLFRGHHLIDSLEKHQNEKQHNQPKDVSEIAFEKVNISSFFKDSQTSEVTISTNSTFDKVNNKMFVEPTEVSFHSNPKDSSSEGEESNIISFEDNVVDSFSSLWRSNKSLLSSSGNSNEGNGSRFVFSSYVSFLIS